MPVMRDLQPGECERLLRRGTFGRVVVCTPRGAEILPVNYAVHENAIVVRISPDGLLARHGHQAELVFEVDLVDHERWHGWSVVARGTGVVLGGPGEAGHTGDTGDTARERPRVRPWADGDRSGELRLEWTELTGRLVGTAWDPESAMFSRRPAQ